MSPVYEEACSKCGVHVTMTDARNTLGDLRDHRLCPVPDPEPFRASTSLQEES